MRGDMQEMLERLPPTTLAELEPGRMIVFSTTSTDATRVTAIQLLAGVEQLVAMMQGGGRGAGNRGGGGAGGGGAASARALVASPSASASAHPKRLVRTLSHTREKLLRNDLFIAGECSHPLLSGDSFYMQRKRGRALMMKSLYKTLGRSLKLALALTLSVAVVVAQQTTGNLRGQLTDEFGGTIVGATVTVTDAAGVTKTNTTDDEGRFAFSGLVPGAYTVRAFAPGFAAYEATEVEVTAGRSEPFDIRLGVELEQQEVTVAAESPLGLDETNRADAIVLRGSDIDALPDDPDELAAALAALAGPSVGPNGGQILIDGFEGGRLPPRDSIREIRINENPISAERDQPGFGGIQIFTKPGTDRLRGSVATTFMDESFNSRNPFAPTRAPYQLRQYSGNLSGTIIPKRASFFLDFERSETDDNDIINAQILNETTFLPERLNVAILTPNRNTTFSPRFDYQLNENNTLVARYSYSRGSNQLLGIGGFQLQSRGFDRERTQHTVQLTETAVLNKTTINETRFQFVKTRVENNGDNSIPAINVQDSFLGGGSQIGNSFNDENRWELTNITTIALGAHSLKFGGRLRRSSITDFSENNFGGTFVFSGGRAVSLDANNQVIYDAAGNPVFEASPITSFERFRRTRLFQRDGLPVNRGALTNTELGFGPTQLNINFGDPEADVSQLDFGGFVQDEWKVRPNFTLGVGLRYETQTNLNSRLSFAPRAFFAWAVDGGGQRQAKTILRGGVGIFYDRFNENLTLQARRFDGTNQLQFQITDPDTLGLYPTLPTLDQLADGSNQLPQVTRRVAADLQSPYSMTGALFLERQLPARFTIFVGGLTFRTRNVLRSRNINAPLPGTFDPNDPENTGVLPFGADAGRIYLYESSGSQNMNQFQVGLQNRFSQAFSMFANYTMFNVKNDTDGPGSFPANSYDLSSEYGRASFDVRHRFSLGGSLGVPWAKLLLNPIIIASSGRPFNITTGRDNNGDGIFADRPAFATANTRPSDLVSTRYGDFDLNPAPGAEIIPRNFAEGPGFFTVNLRVSRQFGFGDVPGARADASTTSQPGDTNAAGGGRGGRGGGGGGSWRWRIRRRWRRYKISGWRRWSWWWRRSRRRWRDGEALFADVLGQLPEPFQPYQSGFAGEQLEFAVLRPIAAIGRRWIRRRQLCGGQSSRADVGALQLLTTRRKRAT